MPVDQSTRATLLAVFVTILWASSWVLIRIGLEDADLDPLGFAALRYGLAAAVLWVAFLRRRSLTHIRRLGPSGFRRLFVLGVVFYAVTQGAQFVAIANQPAATSSLVLSFTPLLTALVAAFALDERLTGIQVLGMLAVVGGAFLYFTGSLGFTAIGMAAAVVGLFANATAAVLGRAVNRDERFEPLTTTTVSMSIGAVVMAVVAVATEGVPTPGFTAIAIIGWLAVVNTAWAFTLWNHSLVHLSAATSSVVNNAMLVEIALLAWIFLDETPSTGQIVAIVVVTSGVVLGTGRVGARSRVAQR